MAFTRFHDPVVSDNWLANSRHNYAVATGATNSANVVLDPVPLAYYNGFIVRLKAAYTATDALYVNVNALGNQPVFVNGATASSSGFVTGRYYELLFDSSASALNILADSAGASSTFDNLTVLGNTTLGDTTGDSLTIGGQGITLASGTTSISGITLFASPVIFQAGITATNATFGGPVTASNASFNGNVQVNGVLTVDGFTASSLAVTGDATLGSGTANTVTLKAGTLTLATGQQIDGAATLNGLVTFASNATFQKTITASNASFNGNVEINGNLTVGDSTADSLTIKAASVALASGTTSIAGQALFTGIVTHATGANFNGAVTLGDATADLITIAGQIVAKGTAGTTGQALLSGGPSGIAAFGDVGFSASTQTEMEAASSITSAVTPGRAQYHPGTAKAWIKYLPPSETLSASHGVSSVSRAGAGNYTVNFTTAFSGTSYAAVASFVDSAEILHIDSETPLTGSYSIIIQDSGGTNADPDILYISFFGDQ